MANVCRRLLIGIVAHFQRRIGASTDLIRNNIVEDRVYLWLTRCQVARTKTKIISIGSGNPIISFVVVVVIVLIRDSVIIVIITNNRATLNKCCSICNAFLFRWFFSLEARGGDPQNGEVIGINRIHSRWPFIWSIGRHGRTTTRSSFSFWLLRFESLSLRLWRILLLVKNPEKIWSAICCWPNVEVGFDS